MLLRFRQGEQYFDLLDDIYPDQTPGRRGIAAEPQEAWLRLGRFDRESAGRRNGRAAGGARDRHPGPSGDGRGEASRDRRGGRGPRARDRGPGARAGARDRAGRRAEGAAAVPELIRARQADDRRDRRVRARDRGGVQHAPRAGRGARDRARGAASRRTTRGCRDQSARGGDTRGRRTGSRDAHRRTARGRRRPPPRLLLPPRPRRRPSPMRPPRTWCAKTFASRSSTYSWPASHARKRSACSAGSRTAGATSTCWTRSTRGARRRSRARAAAAGAGVAAGPEAPSRG